MKKILFLFAFFFLASSPVFGQEVQEISTDQCQTLKGECNVSGSMSCSVNQEVVGRCSTLFGTMNLGACCKMKDNGPQNPNGVNSPGDGNYYNIIGSSKCEAPKAQGGWGGVCRSPSGFLPGVDGCNDSGNDEEDWVGLCNVNSSGFSTRSDCCVAKGTGLVNPTVDNFESKIVTSGTCTSYGGKCEDIDSNGWDPTGGWIDGKEPTCDTSGEVVIGLCQSQGLYALGDAGDAFNGCCVPKSGDYCKKLQADNGGVDVCGTMGAGGNVTPLQYGDYQLLEQIPGSSNTSGELQPYLESIYKAGFVIIVIGAIFMIGFGGFTYMASAGNTSMIKKGKGMITDAIVGLVVALCIWLILNIINPDLVNLKIDPLPGLSFDKDGSGAATAAQNSANEGGTATSSLPAQEAAKKLLAHSNVTLGTSSGNTCPGGNASAKDNLEQAAAGQGMTRCPCGGGGNVAASPTLLNSLVDMANAGAKFRINYIAGACHSSGSNHYDGTSADIQRTSTLDAFFAKYPKVPNLGNTYQVSGVKVWFEDESHYHVSPTGR